MTIKEFTKSAIEVYLSKGGTVHPDITFDIFKLIESNESLLKDYFALCNHHKEVNPTIGKTIRQYFDLTNSYKTYVTGRSKIVKSYMRFKKKA